MCGFQELLHSGFNGSGWSVLGSPEHRMGELSVQDEVSAMPRQETDRAVI
jgi:hypothetical protein